MTEIEARVRLLRIVHLALLASILLSVFLGEQIGTREAKDVRTFQQILIVVFILSLGLIVLVRRRLVQPAREILQLRADDLQALARWQAGNIMAYALCESVALIGLLLRVHGGTLFQAAPFYAAGIVLLLALTPRSP